MSSAPSTPQDRRPIWTGGWFDDDERAQPFMIAHRFQREALHLGETYCRDLLDWYWPCREADARLVTMLEKSCQEGKAKEEDGDALLDLLNKAWSAVCTLRDQLEEWDNVAAVLQSAFDLNRKLEESLGEYDVDEKSTRLHEFFFELVGLLEGCNANLNTLGQHLFPTLKRVPEHKMDIVVVGDLLEKNRACFSAVDEAVGRMGWDVKAGQEREGAVKGEL